MTIDKFAVELSKSISLLPKNKAIAGLIRHAERSIIPKGELGNELRLTPYGKKSTQLLTNLLSNHLIKVFTSPVQRCVQTAKILLTGAQCKLVSSSNLLGDPGIFITDAASTDNYFLCYSPLEIVCQLLNQEANPPGFCRSTNAAVEQLLHFLINNSAEAGITLFVTHDSILSVVLGSLFQEKTIESIWPDFLESLFIWYEPPYLCLLYRNWYKQILWK